MRAGQKVTGYSVQYREMGATTYSDFSVSSPSKTSHTITNLKLGTMYEVRVAAMGPLGLSEYCCAREEGKEVTTCNSECTLGPKSIIVLRYYVPSLFLYIAKNILISFRTICI